MTLAIAFLSGRIAGCVADRRISGSYNKDEFDKVGVVEFTDATLFWTMSGLAEAPSIGYHAPELISKALCDSGTYGRSSTSALPQFTALIAERVHALKRVPLQQRGLTIVFSGYVPCRGELLGLLASVSNCEDEVGVPLPSVSEAFELNATLVDVNGTYLRTTGSGSGLLATSNRVRLHDLLSTPSNTANLMANFVSEVRSVSVRDKRRTVGQRCSSVFATLESPTTWTSDYYTDAVESKSVPLVPRAYAKFDLYGSFVALDGLVQAWDLGGEESSLRVPSVKRRASCPCGSQRRYEDCHGAARVQSAIWRASSKVRATTRIAYSQLPAPGYFPPPMPHPEV